MPNFYYLKKFLRKEFIDCYSDITIPQFKLIKKIAEENTFQLLDISSELEKIKKFLTSLEMILK